MKQNLTQSRLERPKQVVGSYISDTNQHGLHVRIGKRKHTWRLILQHEGRTYDERLGHWPSMSVDAARRAARQLLAEIETGGSSVDVSKLTVADAWQATLKARLAAKSMSLYASLWRLELQALSKHRVRELCHSGRPMLIQLHEDISQRRTQRMANLAIRVLAASINHLQVEYQQCPRLSLRQFPFHPEPPAKYDLGKEAVSAHVSAVKSERNLVRKRFQIALFYTGLRPHSLLSMRAEHFDGSWFRDLPTKVGPKSLPAPKLLRPMLLKHFDEFGNAPFKLQKYSIDGGMSARAVRKHFATVGHKLVPFAHAELLMGHALPGMSAVYVQPPEDELQDASDTIADHLANAFGLM